MDHNQSILAFDWGTRNIGVAIGQTLAATASELKPVAAKDGIPNWDNIEALLKEWKPDLVIVGLPINMDGSDNELTPRARKFANRIHGRFGINVEMMDERLSTVEAKAEAHALGHKGNYKNNPVDSLAARIILESWMNHQSDTKNSLKDSSGSRSE